MKVKSEAKIKLKNEKIQVTSKITTIYLRDRPNLDYLQILNFFKCEIVFQFLRFAVLLKPYK